MLIAPALTIIGVFGLAPLGYAVYLSLFGRQGGAERFIGTANYREALGGEAFWDSVLVTVYFAIGTIPVALTLSFFVAYALFRAGRAAGFLRTLYFLPYVTPVVAAAMVWRALLEPSIGVVNRVMELFGLPGQTWLLEPRGVLYLLTNGAIPADIGPSLALVCVIAFEVWHASGFMIVVLLAGLSAVPPELEDAARLDGAGLLRRVRHVVLPLLSPTLFFLVIVGTIGAFQSFNSFYALTGNGRGPLDTTQNLTVYIFASFYEFGRIGYGAAVAVLLSAVLILLAVTQWRFGASRIHYQ